MRMSIASTNSPSTFLSTPSMPTSAIWCCAQLDEQPAKCSAQVLAVAVRAHVLVEELGDLDRAVLGVDLGQAAELLAGAGLQAAREQRRRGGEVLRPAARRAARRRSRSGSTAAATFCWWVRRSASSALSPCLRASATSSNSCSAFRRPTGTTSADRAVRRRRSAAGRRCGPRRDRPGRLRHAAAQRRGRRGARAPRAAPRGRRGRRGTSAAPCRAPSGSPRSRGRSPVIAGDDLGRLLGRDEDVDPAREARLRWRGRRRRAG